MTFWDILKKTVNKIENATFPYKTSLSEDVNVKTNRMGVQNGHTKNGVLPATTLFFRKFFSQFKNLFILCGWSFIWGLVFPVSILESIFDILLLTYLFL